jgi:ATP-dependent DNA helicase RecG
VTLCATKTYKLGAADSRDFTIWEAKQFGTDIRKVYKYSKAYSGKEEIEFLEQDIFITRVPLDIRFFEAGREDAGINERVNERVKYLAETEKIIYLLLNDTPELTQAKIAYKLNLSEQYVRKIIKGLKDKQLVKRVGSDKKGHWEVIE